MFWGFFLAVVTTKWREASSVHLYLNCKLSKTRIAQQNIQSKYYSVCVCHLLDGVRPIIRHPDSPTTQQSDIPVVQQSDRVCTINSYSTKIKIYVLYKKYSPSQVLCTVKARSVVKLTFKGSFVVQITYYKFMFVKLQFSRHLLQRIKRRKVRIYCLYPEYVAFAHCSDQLFYPRRSFHSGTNCLLHRLCRKKKLSGEEDKNI